MKLRPYEFRVGDKIRILEMKGEPQYGGKTGVIERIDDMGQLLGTWGWLAVQPGNDTIEIIRRAK